MPTLDPVAGPYAKDMLTATLHTACDSVGLDPSGAELIHVTVNALFKLRDVPVIARISDTRTLLPRVYRVVRAARWLEACGFPAVRLTGPTDQPIIVEATGHAVTFWAWMPQPASEARAFDLAEPLRRLHALPAPPFPLPAWDPLSEARERIASAEHLSPADRLWLSALADRLDEELPRIDWALPRAVIHGDAYIGNVLRDEHGAPTLCDLDVMCFGPPEWDLIPELVACYRYGRPVADYQRLVDAYGFDPRDWLGWPVLRLVRELNVLTGVLPMLASSPGIRAEYRRRMSGLRHGHTDQLWTPYRKIA